MYCEKKKLVAQCVYVKIYVILVQNTLLPSTSILLKVLVRFPELMLLETSQ